MICQYCQRYYSSIPLIPKQVGDSWDSTWGFVEKILETFYLSSLIRPKQPLSADWSRLIFFVDSNRVTRRKSRHVLVAIFLVSALFLCLWYIESEDPRLCVLNAVDSKFTHGLVSPRWICFHGSSDGAANKWILKVSYGSFDSAVPLPMDANTDGLCLRNIGSQRCLSDVVKLWSIRHIVDWYYDQSSGGSTFIVSGEYQINTNFWLQKMDGWLPHHFNTSLESTTIDSSRHWDSEPEVDDWFFVQWPLDQKLPQV